MKKRKIRCALLSFLVSTLHRHPVLDLDICLFFDKAAEEEMGSPDTVQSTTTQQWVGEIRCTGDNRQKFL